MQIKHATVGASSGSAPNTVKNYVVDDATPTMQRVDGQDISTFFTSTSVQQKTEQSLPPQRQSLAEKLLFLGRAEKEVEIGGLMFKLATLTSKETSDMVKELALMNENDNTTVQILVLAQAIKSVDGIPLDNVQLPGEFENAFKKRRAIIEQFQQTIVNKLID